jgi:hypothetical protein
MAYSEENERTAGIAAESDNPMQANKPKKHKHRRHHHHVHGESPFAPGAEDPLAKFAGDPLAHDVAKVAKDVTKDAHKIEHHIHVPRWMKVVGAVVLGAFGYHLYTKRKK